MCILPGERGGLRGKGWRSRCFLKDYFWICFGMVFGVETFVLEFGGSIRVFWRERGYTICVHLHGAFVGRTVTYD